jgi:hypothetical protein
MSLISSSNHTNLKDYKKGDKMSMKLYDFVEIVTEIKNPTIYVENYTCEQNSEDKEVHSVEINVEDTDTENIEATYIIEAETKKALDQQVKFTLGGYFNKIDVVNKLY